VLEITSEVSVPLRLLVSILTLTSFSWAASFDKPLYQRAVELGPSQSTPGARARVTCYFFPMFMVKEVDLGEKGANRLAIVPATKIKSRTCSRLYDQDEKVIDSDEWSGYFKGVKGSLVFFDADDGVNGGMGFAVYDAKSGKKIFSDIAAGPLAFPDRQDKAVSITYTRVVEGECVVPKDQAACWDKIKRKLGLENAPAPDCKAGYEKSAQALAKGRCQAQNSSDAQCLAKEIQLARQQSNDSPSVASYPVEVLLAPEPVIKPVSGNVLCWPAD
jgi:hypothetical protein